MCPVFFVVVGSKIYGFSWHSFITFCVAESAILYMYHTQDIELGVALVTLTVVYYTFLDGFKQFLDDYDNESYVIMAMVLRRLPGRRNLIVF